MSGDEMAFPFRVNGVDYSGVTKREYFAAMAMQGLLSNLEAIRREGFQDRDIEEFAIMRADALIAALNAEPQS